MHVKVAAQGISAREVIVNAIDGELNYSSALVVEKTQKIHLLLREGVLNFEAALAVAERRQFLEIARGGVIIGLAALESADKQFAPSGRI